MEGTINSSSLTTFFPEDLMVLPTLCCGVHSAIDFEAQTSLLLVCKDILRDSLLVLLDCPLIEFPLNFSDDEQVHLKAHRRAGTEPCYNHKPGWRNSVSTL